MTRICHLTSAHPPLDIRIFHKECRTLAREGYEVVLVAPHDKDEIVETIRIRRLKNAKNRSSRFTGMMYTILQSALRENAVLYHIHDPDLIFIGLYLRRKGKKVVYDVHDDIPRAIQTREWIPGILRKPLSVLFEYFENSCAQRMDCIVAATPFIRERFLSIGCRAVNINNYPIRSELYSPQNDWKAKEDAVCFVGSIDQMRGINELIIAIGRTRAKLILAGAFSPASHRKVASQLPGWRKVEELGQIDRSEVAKVYSRSMAGAVLYHEHPNHVNAQPNKMFEYMSAGIPVIASHFPLWKTIVEGYRCGICCDPKKPAEIAGAIQWIADHPEEARIMGANGRKAVEEKFNWENEGEKLIALYEELLN